MSDINLDNYCILIKPADLILELVSPKDRVPTLEELYQWLNCQTVQVIELGGGHILVVDEEGLFKGDGRNPDGYFALDGFDGFGQTLAGRGLIMYAKYGEMLCTPLKIQDIANKIYWL